MKRSHWGVLFFALVLLGIGVYAGRRIFQPTAPSFWSTGPMVYQLEKMGYLTVTKVYISDVLIAQDNRYRGAWLIKGDALIAVDCMRAEIVEKNIAQHKATIRLPQPAVISSRVDHERTRTWEVSAYTWIPWRSGDKDTLRDDAMQQAQMLIEHTANSTEYKQKAREQAEVVIAGIYQLVGWDVTVVWR